MYFHFKQSLSILILLKITGFLYVIKIHIPKKNIAEILKELQKDRLYYMISGSGYTQNYKNKKI